MRNPSPAWVSLRLEVDVSRVSGEGIDTPLKEKISLSFFYYIYISIFLADTADNGLKAMMGLDLSLLTCLLTCC